MDKAAETPAVNCCTVNIHIHSSGNINIYNCCPAVKNCDCEDALPGSDEPDKNTGNCIPNPAGAKSKQSKTDKLNRLMNNKVMPSAFASSFLQTARRFAAGKMPANGLEKKFFKRFTNAPANIQRVLRCTCNAYEALSPEHKTLFDDTLLQNIDQPVTPTSLEDAWIKEITGIVNWVALGNHGVELKETPGKVRLYNYGTNDDVYPPQVHIFKINDLRTTDYIPSLALSEFLPEEFQNTCTPVSNTDGTYSWNCSLQQPPCDGNPIENQCLRVQQVQSGTSVKLEGVNFFDVNTTVILRLKGTSNDISIDAFVSGDTSTPVKETINGQQVLIADNRVKDQLFFTVPDLTAPGIYELYVKVPNSSGFHGPGFGDFLTTFAQYIEVVLPDTARFSIATERLWARKETSPTWPGSDEVGIRINTMPLFADGSVGAMQEQKYRFDDVDSQETRPMDALIFSHSQSIAGVIISILGYEIDGEDAYQHAVTEWTSVFEELVKEQWNYISSSAVVGALLAKLSGIGFWGYVAVAIAAALTLAVDLFVSLWAPADLIIQDTIGLSVTDLARLTSSNFPPALADSDKTLYVTAGGIDVRLMTSVKLESQYQEERGYLSDQEDSWYNITFSYKRLT